MTPLESPRSEPSPGAGASGRVGLLLSLGLPLVFGVAGTIIGGSLADRLAGTCQGLCEGMADTLVYGALGLAIGAAVGGVLGALILRRLDSRPETSDE